MCCNFLCFITAQLAIAVQSTQAYEAFSASETAAACTKCLDAPLQHHNTQLFYKHSTTQLHQIQTSVFPCSPPTQQVQAVYSIFSSAQLRPVVSSSGFQTQYCFLLRWESSVGNSTFLGAWLCQGLTSQELRETYQIIY